MRYRAISASALRRPRAFVYHPVGRALSRGSSLHRGRCGQGRPGRERCMQRFEVGSEIGRLRSVLLHEPDLELTRLTPANVHELLFDEIMWVERAQLEHRAFAQVLRDRGVEVLLLGDLLAETLTEEAARKELLDRVVTIDAFGQSLAPDVREWFDSLPERELARYLIGGVIPEDLPFSPQGLVGASFQPTTFVLPPLPNQIFVRDTSAWMYGGVSINPMAFPARRREILHLEAVYRHHPVFASAAFPIWYGGDGLDHYPAVVIEAVAAVPDREGRRREHRVVPVHGLQVQDLAPACGERHRVDRHAAVHPRRGVADEDLVGQRRQHEGGRLEAGADQPLG